MNIKKLLSGVLLALAGQGALLALAYLLRRQSFASDSVSITLRWMILFAGFTAGVISLGERKFAVQASRSRPIFLIAPILLALFGYIVALLATHGLIRNLGFPLLLIFLAGSVPAFVGSFWKGKFTSASISLLVILVVGCGPVILFWLTERDHPLRVTVVKLVPGDAADLTIAPQAGIELAEPEKKMLLDLHLRGEAQITENFEIGLKEGAPSHTMIVLTRPLAAEVFFHEAKGNVVYLQDGPDWRRIPRDAGVSWRTIQMYPTSSRCSVIGVWRRLGRRTISQGPCW